MRSPVIETILFFALTSCDNGAQELVVEADPLAADVVDSSEPIDVTLVASMADATIYYTLDGSAPDTSSTVYDQPISLTEDTTLRFFATVAAAAESPSIFSSDFLDSEFFDPAFYGIGEEKADPISPIVSQSYTFATIETFEEAEEEAVEESTPTIDSATSDAECTTAGGYWYGGDCNAAMITCNLADYAIADDGKVCATIPSPTISSVSPTSGLATGGSTITITGTYFVGATVTVGGVSCTSIAINTTYTQITCTNGAHDAGSVDVVVTNGQGTATTMSGGFTYLSLKPTGVTISTTSDLNLTPHTRNGYTTTVSLATHSTDIKTVSGSGAAATGSGTTATDGSVTASTSPMSTTSAIATTSDTVGSATINVSGTFADGTTQACSVLSPFTSLTCSFPSFSMTLSEQDSGTLQIQALPPEGTTSDATNSNTLTVTTKYKVVQISNTRADNSVGDFPSGLTVYNSHLFFSAQNSNGYKLFKYDDSANQVIQISDIRSGSNDSPSKFYVFNSKLYFIALNSSSRYKIYEYNDSAGTLNQISNIYSSFYDTTQPEFSDCNSDLYFLAYPSGTTYLKLFVFDTSANEIKQVSNEEGSSATDNFADYTCFNSKLYFTNPSGTTTQRFFYRVNADFSVTQVSATDGGNSSSDNANNVHAYNSKLYMVAYVDSQNNGSSYWHKLVEFSDSGDTFTWRSKTRGTSGNDSPSSSSQVFKVHNSKLFFSSLNSNAKHKLYAFNGSGNTIAQITDIRSNGHDNPLELTEFSSKLFFTAETSSGIKKLFSYDDTSGVLRQLSNIAGSSVSDDISDLTVMNNDLFFIAQESSSGPKRVYVYNDISSTLEKVSYTSKSSTASDSISEMLVHNNRLYFVANNENGVSKLWVLCNQSVATCP